MKRFQWTVAMLLVVVAQCARADSISTFKITVATVYVFQAQFYGDDNLAFIFTGPGTSVSGGGEMLCQDWCSFEGFPAGSKSPVVFDDIYLSEVDDGKLGGQDFFFPYAEIGPIVLSTSGNGFTFPLNFKGSSFTACQPAAISSPIPGSVYIFNGENEQIIDFALLMPAGGKFCSTWNVYHDVGGGIAGFVFEQGKFVASSVPEPGTLGLVGSGMAGLVGVVLRKRTFRRSRN